MERQVREGQDERQDGRTVFAMSRHYNPSPRARCPKCNGGWLDRRWKQWRCKSCGNHFSPELAILPAEKKKKEPGIKAGTITIGRGSVWGAGLV